MTRLTNYKLPAYSYVPGQFPHPRSHADGHSYGKPEPVVTAFTPARWQDCQAFLWGIDLFNLAYYWEAHEQWEAVWLCVGRKGDVADFLKGLIKLSAMGVKAKEGNAVGFRRHQARAIQLFQQVGEQHARLSGFELDSLLRKTKELDAQTSVTAVGVTLNLLPNSN